MGKYVRYILKTAGMAVAIAFCFFLLPANGQEYSADATPWSGYWWPYSRGGLATGKDYRGTPAPLGKYELLTNGGYPGLLTSWYLNNYYDMDAPSWYGLCANWAMASCYEHIDFYPSSENNIIFRVGDKKGLMTLAHADDLRESGDGSIPEVFHYWLLHYIKDQGKAFVADLDSTRQIWSFPIYRFIMSSTVSGDKESVRVTIFYADDMVEPDYMGTIERRKTYTYDLYTRDDGQDIYNGEWTNGSVNDHPELLTLPIMVRGKTPHLDYNEVLRLAKSKDDFLEDEDRTVPVMPGTYNLILMDEDLYQVDCKPDDTVSIIVEKQAGSMEKIEAVITDILGNKIVEKVVDTDDSINLLFEAQNPPYTIRLTQANYDDPNIYTLKVELRRAFQQVIPYIPKNEKWSGFAITNSSRDKAENITFVTYSLSGDPVQTVLGPLDLASGEKRIFLFDQLDWRLHERPSSDRLLLISDQNVNIVNLIGSNESGTLSSFYDYDPKAMRIIIPDTFSIWNLQKKIAAKIFNNSFEDIEISLQMYAENGTLLSDNTQTITKGGTIPVTPGNGLFAKMEDDGWIEVFGDKGQIGAFQYLSSKGRAESMIGLTADSSIKFIPHVPPPAGWWNTRVTLINPTNSVNRVNFHLAKAGNKHDEDMNIELDPKEKRVFEIQDQFGRFMGDPLHRSILEISGEQAIVGYYTYYSPNGGDEASFPLLDEKKFDMTLVMPHNAGRSGSWWTGAGLCNPSGVAVTVKVEPYGYDGKIIEDIVENIDLDIGNYTIMTTMDSFFNHRNADVSFVIFRVIEPENGYIGGFYIYGKMNQGRISTEMLSGANM
ncbi:hypothetical protein QUF76_16970 [Desulfobacterales bacterium HSG16]|nr:hypothetical protein [Desulfobacterales bacterium HSG16]